MDCKNIFNEFATLLGERLALGVFTTEDSIRYTFYTALVQADRVKHTDIILEYPHPTIPGAEIDTIIRESQGSQSVAIEFKYDRANPGGTNQNRTQRAATALVDVFHLARIPSSVANRKYFLYITDAEMATYFRNPVNRLNGFFEIDHGVGLELRESTFHGLSQTFVNRITPFICDCHILGAFSADLPAGHHVRAFEVLGY